MEKDTRPTLSLKAESLKKVGVKKRRKQRPTPNAVPKQESPKKFGVKSGKEIQNSTDSRYIAFNILDAIIERRQMLEAAFANSEGFNALEARDKGLVKLIVATCLRRHGQLTAILKNMISDQTATSVSLVLKIGLTQLLFLNLSEHAATNTTVELVKKIGYERQSGLVNAVLRRTIREKDIVGAKTTAVDNLPASLRESWKKNWGTEQTAAIAELTAQTPPLDITGTGDITALAQKLEGSLLTQQTIRCSFDGDIRNMPDYDIGNWWVQDAAAALPVYLMGDVAGKNIWDLCAAPGGKTAQLIAKGATVTAVDKETRRIDRLRANLKRLNMHATIKKADILDDDFSRTAQHNDIDMILLDAPCSATGTIRRHPDILVRAERPGLATLQKIQIQMLKNCLNWLKPKASVLYVTCSLEPEEGEQVVDAVIQYGLGKTLPFTATELGPFAAGLTPEGWARILPNCLVESELNKDTTRLGNDGFFIARLAPSAA